MHPHVHLIVHYITSLSTHRPGTHIVTLHLCLPAADSIRFDSILAEMVLLNLARLIKVGCRLVATAVLNMQNQNSALKVGMNMNLYTHVRVCACLVL